MADLAVLEPRDALTILFFGGIISFFLLGLILFLFRFALNLIWGGIICRIPSDWHSFATSIILIVLVSISFPMIEEVKMAGRIAYCHVTELVRIAKNHDMTIRIDAASMKKTKRFTNEQEF